MKRRRRGPSGRVGEQANRAKARESQARAAAAADADEVRRFLESLMKRLKSLVGNDQAGFERRTGVAHGTLQGWVQSGKDYTVHAPNAESLYRVVKSLGVSVDWMFGFDVPRDRDERTGVADLARQLTEHVIGQYFATQKPPYYFTDALLEVLGGGRESGRRDDGRPIVEASNPKALLEAVTRWAVERVQAAGDAALQRTIGELGLKLPLLSAYAGSGTMSEGDASQQLFRAMAQPRTRASQLAVRRVFQAVAAAEQAQSRAADERQLRDRIDKSAARFERSKPVPGAERPSGSVASRTARVSASEAAAAASEHARDQRVRDLARYQEERRKARS